MDVKVYTWLPRDQIVKIEGITKTEKNVYCAALCKKI